MTSGLAGLACFLLTGLTALAQEGVRDLPALQLFNPADVRPCDEWNTPKEGFFFSFDGIFWTISAPKKTTIGNGQTAAVVYSGGTTTPEDVPGVDEDSMDTGGFRAKQKTGDRLEFGYTGEHHGFLVSTFELDGQTQHIAGDNVHVVFNDPQGFLTALNYMMFGVTGRAPVVFDMSLTNHTYTDGVEALYTYRQHQFANGGQLQWMFGGRYVRFDDEFDALGTGAYAATTLGSGLVGSPGILDSSEWDTTARNRIGGPEIGLRYSQQFGRLALSTEGRFMAGINSQDIRQWGTIASNLQLNSTNYYNYYNYWVAYHSSYPYYTATMPMATSFSSSLHKTEFTPLVEFRVEGHVQLTQLISFKVGWTGIFMSGIARASNLVNYTLPNMGILEGGNQQTVFMQGVNVGVELNR